MLIITRNPQPLRAASSPIMNSIGQTTTSPFPIATHNRQFHPHYLPQQGRAQISAAAATPNGSTFLQVETPSGSRKRSREDAAENLDEATEYFGQALPTLPSTIKETAYNNELIDSCRGIFPPAAISPSRESAEEMEVQKSVANTNGERPMLRSHKSQRLDITAAQAFSDGVSSPHMSSSPTRQSPSRRDPPIDAFTLHLGIGWSRISDDKDMQAAARGWAKYIENHFPVTDVTIVLQSRGLQSYLVEAREGWFLFVEDLHRGQLVATTLEKTFENLRGPAPIFDGQEVLVAMETPAAGNQEPPMFDEPHVYAGSMHRRQEFFKENSPEKLVQQNGVATQPADDAMDMN